MKIRTDLKDVSLHPGEGIQAWQSYLPRELAEIWKELTDRERTIIVMLCQQQADTEEWD
jgi:hypothetical protein